MLSWRKRNSYIQSLAGNDEGEIMTCIKSSSFWNPLFVWWIRSCFSWLLPLHLRGHAMWLNTPHICVFFACIYLELRHKIQCHSAQCSSNSFLSFFSLSLGKWTVFLCITTKGIFFTLFSQKCLLSLLASGKLEANAFWNIIIWCRMPGQGFVQ